MDLIKKSIYLDLEKYFQGKVHNKKLFSCLIHDFLFAQLVIGPLFVVTWRGTWQNADALFDQQIFQGNLKVSAIFVLVLGLLVSALLTLAQHSIKALSMKWNRIWFIFFSRFFTIIIFYSDLLIWKGIWGFFNCIVYNQLHRTWITSLCLCIFSTVTLFMLRSSKSSVGPPMGISIDRPKDYISVSTFLSTTPDDSYQRRFLDLYISKFVTLISITAFYGYWSGMDHVFESFMIALDLNSMLCIVS